MRFCILVFTSILIFSLLVVSACEKADAPSNIQIAVFEGSDYEQGYQHGEMYGDLIRSLWTRLLENSLIPYLNTERISIAPVLGMYYNERYDDGNFAYQLLLESAYNLLDGGHIPDNFIDEMHGIADGAAIDFDKILILNTFFDTLMGFRAVSMFIQNIQKPYIRHVDFGDLSTDGFDNDDDGEIDEDGEGYIDEYDQTPNSLMLEVSPDEPITITFQDEYLGGMACLDAGNVEPLGERRAYARCIKDECILPGCEQFDILDRECIVNLPDTQCLAPTIAVECFEYECVEAYDPSCVDPDSIRIQVNETLYVKSDPEQAGYFKTELIPFEEYNDDDFTLPRDHPHYEDCKGLMKITFTPPEPLPAASKVALKIQILDSSNIYVPEPFHPRAMRDERIMITTKGYSEKTGNSHLWQVDNDGFLDGRAPTSVSFAARNSATSTGEPIMAQHYMLIDSDIMHEHSLLQVHIPEKGKPHVTLGWAGFIWGFAGLNSDGLAYTVNNSDTLDSPLVGNVVQSIFDRLNEILSQPDLTGLSKILDDVGLVATGRPLGMMGREILANYSTTDEAFRYLYQTRQTFGWNFILLDADSDMISVEVDAASRSDRDYEDTEPKNVDGFKYFRPASADPDCPNMDEDKENDDTNLDAHCLPYASAGQDDLVAGSHFSKNVNDVDPIGAFGPFSPHPQRRWTPFYYRSLRTFHALKRLVKENYGKITVGSTINMMREPIIVDYQDSMSAVIIEPASGRFNFAAGGVPATDMPYLMFDLEEFLASRKGGQK